MSDTPHPTAAPTAPPRPPTARSGRGGFSHLFTPWRVGHLTLPNRVVMGSMHMGMEDSHADLPRLAEFYATRARGGVGLIVTGGFAPNRLGRLSPGAGMFAGRSDAEAHRVVTDAVHAKGGRILAQLLHAGRYAKSPLQVSASRTRAPISPVTAFALPTAAVRRTVRDFVRAAGWARQAGYDGVEVMASEGYLINQFLAPATNHRTDRYGGSAENRRRFLEEIVSGIREAAGEEFVVSVRLSMVDLVQDGQSLEEILDVARAVERCGADLINTGIGWHESRVPTIVTSVPRAAFAAATARVKQAVDIPVSASNRITLPHTAEQILAAGQADAVTMARPFLADADWVAKAREDHEAAITPCIGCNQACLDHAFSGRTVTCLVNPRAGRETEEPYTRLGMPSARRADSGRRVAVVGGGPAGLAAAHAAAEAGHTVTLFEADQQVGGQFRLARQIPGKEEFAEALAHFRDRLDPLGVDVRTGVRADAALLTGAAGETAFDHVVVATGVVPRELDIPGIDRPEVHAYPDVVDGTVTCGDSVAVIGAGGIGVDVAELLTAPAGHRHGDFQERADWEREWGVDPDFGGRGGLAPRAEASVPRTVHLLQRSPGKIGARLGATTGWVHRAALKARGVQQHAGVRYLMIDDDGLHIEVTRTVGRLRKRTEARRKILAVTDVVVCAGQESEAGLAGELRAAGMPDDRIHVVGGALKAGEIDAKRAIDEAVRAVAEI
ncbi:FAD-dependent oxidoreductase [Micrococcus luteus]